MMLPNWAALAPGTPYWLTTEVPTIQPEWPAILHLAQTAEEVGFDNLWLVDHFQIRVDPVNVQFGRPPMPAPLDGQEIGVMDCWTLMGALAAATTQVTLGPLVSCMSYRNPAVLAKIAATVDSISNGRVILGIGAGDFEEEHAQFGAHWDRRISQFEEGLQILVPLLRTGHVDFAGAFYKAANCTLSPAPARPGGPPILIGALGHGPRMLRLVAQYADAWNAFIATGESSPAVIPAYQQMLDDACRAIGRDPATLKRTVTVGVTFGNRTIWGASPITGSARQIADVFLAFHDEGIEQLSVFMNPMTEDGIMQMAEVIRLCKAA